MGRGRELWTRRAMVRSLEDRLWRLDVHPRVHSWRRIGRSSPIC
jgi:hypothetical protein